jgi:O-antigen ligase
MTYTFRDWQYWYANLPWALRWYAFLIVLRPIADNFYYLKDISLFLSPLYIIGLLTPLLSISGIRNFSIAPNAKQMGTFNVWAFLLIFSSITIFLVKLKLGSLEAMLKISFPVYVFYFVRRIIYNVEDLYGLLYAFLISAYIGIGFLFYEVLVNPIQEVEYSRGVERLRAGYADVMNLGIYASMGFLVSIYFFIKRIKIRFLFINNIFLIIPTVLMVVTKINHVASYGVLAALIVFSALIILRGNVGIGFIAFIIILLGLVYFGEVVFEENIEPLIRKDMQVLEGEYEETALLHGRVGRWKKLLQGFQYLSIPSKLFGSAIELKSYYVMNSGVHNDYIRILFATGIVGLVMYLSFVFHLIFKSFLFQLAERYLILGSIIVLLMYSISTTPTFYASFMYVFLTIAAFISLSPNVAYEYEEDEE